MAWDWIKVRINLANDVDVLRMAKILKERRALVVGGLVILWCWANENTTDGVVVGLDAEDIDALVEIPGLSSAMQQVGWLEFRDDGLVFPEFDRHNGETAKERAMSARRNTSYRTRKSDRDASVTLDASRTIEQTREVRDANVTLDASRSDANVRDTRDANVTLDASPREEKRREDASGRPATFSTVSAEQEPTAEIEAMAEAVIGQPLGIREHNTIYKWRQIHSVQRILGSLRVARNLRLKDGEFAALSYVDKILNDPRSIQEVEAETPRRLATRRQTVHVPTNRPMPKIRFDNDPPAGQLGEVS